jgi:thymidylate kinase
MLILIEGTDGAGKTTLAQRVVDELHQRYPYDEILAYHAGPPRQHPLDEYETPLLGYRPNRGTHVVCDRWHWGERVYPEILGRDSQLTREVWMHLELFLASRGALVVHVTVPTDVLRDRLAQRGDDLVTETQAVAARDGFYRADHYSVLPRVMSGDGHHALSAGLVVDAAEVHERLARKLNAFTTYIGRPQPDLLLLGDVRGGDPETHGLAPAFQPRNGNSGTYLLTCLIGRTWGGTGIANANDVDHARELWEVLNRPPTVTLGKNAAAAVTWAHREVPHPQWVRRFHHDRWADYRRQLLGEDITWN